VRAGGSGRVFMDNSSATKSFNGVFMRFTVYFAALKY
jgi:hypothetical protein